MKTTYDPQADALYIYLAPGAEPVKQQHVREDEFILDVDSCGRVIGIEILHAKKNYPDIDFSSLKRP